ncbi:unnamed protein product [Alternaria burnsii]|nr:unnamed protein product [Alternaria burnsii]
MEGVPMCYAETDTEEYSLDETSSSRVMSTAAPRSDSLSRVMYYTHDPRRFARVNQSTPTSSLFFLHKHLPTRIQTSDQNLGNRYAALK